MDEEVIGDRWSIGDLRDRSQAPNVDHFLVAPELERLRRRVEELERQLGEPVAPAASLATGFTFFFLGSRGYEVVDGDGALPAVGASVVVGGERFVVDAIRRSPFPSDSRPCVVLARPHSSESGDGITSGRAP